LKNYYFTKSQEVYKKRFPELYTYLGMYEQWSEDRLKEGYRPRPLQMFLRSAAMNIVDNNVILGVPRAMEYGFPSVSENGLAAEGNETVFYAQNTNMLNGFAGVQQTLCQGFSGIDRSIANLGYQQAQCCCDIKGGIKDVAYGNEKNAWTISKQISDCCCDLEKANMQNRFDAQAYNCNTLQAIDKVGDRIIDYLANEKTQALRDENFALRLSASQAKQNELLLGKLSPFPTPAYVVPNPNCCYQPVSFNTCGCNGSF
jgi:hypothetical protein